jgi:branched-chain amino acid transport system substrate-binding protein
VSTASVVYADDPNYGQPSAEAFKKSFVNQGGNITQYLSFSSNPESSSQLDTIASALANTPNPGMIYIAGLEGPTHDVVVALRRHHVVAPIFCSGTTGQDEFAQSFAPEEGNQQPGTFTEGVYATSPIIFDSAPDKAQAFATQYQQTYGNVPGSYGAMLFASAQVAVAALKKAQIEGTLASLEADRKQIAQQLGTIDSLQTSVATLVGSVYFDQQTTLLPLRFGQFSHGRISSLPTQLVPALNLAPADLIKQQSAGEIIQVDGQSYWKQHVIYTGIDINKISNIDTTTSTFSADFFFWMRFNSSEDATAIAFTNALNVSFDANVPLDSRTTVDGLLYRLYHVTGEFKATYDFHDYPFDQQQLRISFQNTRLTNDHLIYSIDTRGLRLRDDNTLDPTRGAAILQSLSSWNYLSTQYSSDTFTSDTTRGDPELFNQQTVTAYSGLQVTMMVQRKSVAYMISHLLPLLLLFLLVYASLFLPHNEHLGERLELVVAALLTGAILLLSINSELPEIGYVVSIQYIYYIFFFLCFICTVVPMFMKRQDDGREERLQEKGDENTVAKDWRDISLHIFYLVVVFCTIIGYLIVYSSRFA